MPNRLTQAEGYSGPVFDCHVHIFPDKIAEATVAALGKEADITPFYDGTREGLRKSMADAGIAIALNCPIATRPEQVGSINRWAATQNFSPIFSLGTTHPDCPNQAEILADIRDAGLRGIKLHPEYQQFMLGEARLDPVWKACEELGLTVLLHTGADIAFEPPFRSNPAAVRDLLRRYPRLTVIAAHFGSWDMWDAVERDLIGSPCYLDISFTLGMLPDDKMVELIRAHGISRVLFGTDAPWRSQKKDLEYFLRLPLAAAEQRLILWDNSARLFGIS